LNFPIWNIPDFIFYFFVQTSAQIQIFLKSEPEIKKDITQWMVTIFS